MAARAYDCLQGDLRAKSNQQIRFASQQFGRADKWTAGIVDGTIFNNDILSFAKPILFQLRRKDLVDFGSRGCAVRPEKSYSGIFSTCCA